MADANQFVNKVDVMKESFGWEVPVELVPIPSKGVIYNPETKLYKKENVKIKAMTAKEEDILSSAALIKEGTVLDYLIDSCVTEDIDPRHMIIGDRNAIMIAIRITGYGPEYPVKAFCKNCGHANHMTIDLTSIPIKRLEITPEQEGKNLFKFLLPVTKKTVYFKFPTISDERNRDIKEKNLSKHIQSMISSNVTSNLEVAIQQIEDVTDRNKIKHFILNMPAYDSRALRRFIKESEPGMDMYQNYECEKCQTSNRSSIPITSEFFWPST
jgi:hypothetical protein